MRVVYDHDWLSNQSYGKKHCGQRENVRRDFDESKQGLPAGLLPHLEIDWEGRIPSDGLPLKCFLTHTRAFFSYKWRNWMIENCLPYPHGNLLYTIQLPFDLKVKLEHVPAASSKAFENAGGHKNLEVTPHIGGTKAKGRANNVLVYLPRSNLRCLDDRKGLNPDDKGPLKHGHLAPNIAGRLQKWSIMLGEHNITYRPRTSVKGQILADFLVEKPEEASADTSEKEVPQEPWTLFMDGSSCIDGSGASLILTSPDGAEFTYALRFQLPPLTTRQSMRQY
ncbi:hypothetical protein Tco_1008923 [Tanacetum coccineum]